MPLLADTIFTDYITKSILREGGSRYTNDPADRGGETIWGICVATARAFGYDGDMRDMTREQALAIYRTRFWANPQFDQLCIVDRDLGGLLLDIGINRGPSVPSKWLQRSLNVLNNQGTIYPDIPVDGAAFDMTRAALAAFKRARGGPGMVVLFRLIESFAAVAYVEIAEKNPTQERFEYGWLLNRAFQGATTT